MEFTMIFPAKTQNENETRTYQQLQPGLSSKTVQGKKENAIHLEAGIQLSSVFSS